MNGVKRQGMADDADEEVETSDAHAEVHERAMRRFTDAVLPQIPVRELALAARRFASIPGATWEGAWGDQYANSIKIEMPDKINRAVRKLKNDLRQNRVVPDFRPAGGSSDQDTADTLDGMHRADSYHYKAQQARDNACEEAAYGGFGAYRLANEWSDPLDKDSDHQRINPGLLINDADQKVFFGPSNLYDKSDCEYAFVLVSHSPEAFKDEWGEDKVASWPDELPRYWYDWFRPDEIVTCEYYEIEERNESLLVFTQQDTDEEQRHWEKELEPEERANLKALGWKERKRTVKRRRCYKYVLSGVEVLEGAKRIAGGNIPIVPVYYNRNFIDGVEWFKGIVQDRMDAMRLYNGQLSNLAEISALAPYERPIFAAEQMPPNLAALWERGNVDRHPYALVEPLRNEDGSIASAGAIGKVEPPQVPTVLAALLEISNRDLTEDDADDSQQVKANTSEEAMQLAAQRIDAKSGPFLDNVRQSVQREGELYLDMACEVYTEPGRDVETMTEEGGDGTATLHEDYYDGQVLKTRNNFSEGKYKVVASVTEATATRKDRTVKQMMTVAEVAIQAQDVQGAQAAIITATANMDGEGLDDFQKWNRKRGLELGLFQPTEEEQREAEEAAQQQQQQPNPQAMLLQEQLKKLAADTQKALTAAGLDQAKIQETMASAGLKVAQADALGGPEAAPEVPTGLQAANDIAKQEGDLARANLHNAQASQIREQIGHQRLRTGHELEMERRAQDLAERAQDHAEKAA